jgi:malate synthase
VNVAERVEVGGLKVDQGLHDLVRDEIAPGTGIDPETFWTCLAEIVRDLEPKNRRLLDKRDALQAKIDAWHLQHKGRPLDREAYKTFLREIDLNVP